MKVWFDVEELWAGTWDHYSRHRTQAAAEKRRDKEGRRIGDDYFRVVRCEVLPKKKVKR